MTMACKELKWVFVDVLPTYYGHHEIVAWIEIFINQVMFIF
jgi:hypothetical protein